MNKLTAENILAMKEFLAITIPEYLTEALECIENSTLTLSELSSIQKLAYETSGFLYERAMKVIQGDERIPGGEWMHDWFKRTTYGADLSARNYFWDCVLYVEGTITPKSYRIEELLFKIRDGNHHNLDEWGIPLVR